MNWREQMAQALMARQPEETPPPLEMPGGSPVAPHGIDALPLQIGMQGAAPVGHAESAAAIHYKGETFSGPSHADALAKIIARHPEDEAAIDANPDVLHIGLIRDGRFKEVPRLYPQPGDVGVRQSIEQAMGR